ncbi:MAG: hypothetical protein H6Q59_324 [Firmicutes bacterium]|nr:hypothetical protein [Bacillota bacterium]
MYNDNFNKNRENTNRYDNVQRQQMGPGGFPPPPPNIGPQGPGMENQPRSAPPDFIPEAPRMDRRQMGAPDEQNRTGFGVFIGPGRPGPGGNDRSREMRRCLNRFTYFWLFNGNDFWFYPTFVDRQIVQGFRWRRNRWEFDRINLNRIFFFRCF